MTKRTTIGSLKAEVNSIKDFVSNQTSTLRRQIGSVLGLSHDGKRNVYDIYGYPETLDSEGGYSLMYRYSRRQGIASRITRGIPKRCWRDGFEIYDSPEEDAKPVLVDEVGALDKAGLTRKMEAADKLNRIGRFSVLYVLIPNQNPKDPISLSTVGANLENVRFIAYPYDGVQISKQVQDATDPRYGLPEFYSLQRGQSMTTEKDTSLNAIQAHWSRVVHLNENATESDIEGMGALEPIFNNILDIEKATGGASEAYFRNARGKIGYEIDP